MATSGVEKSERLIGGGPNGVSKAERDLGLDKSSQLRLRLLLPDSLALSIPQKGGHHARGETCFGRIREANGHDNLTEAIRTTCKSIAVDCPPPALQLSTASHCGVIVFASRQC